MLSAPSGQNESFQQISANHSCYFTSCLQSMSNSPRTHLLMTWANICHHTRNVGFCQHKSCLIACQMTNKLADS